MHRDEQIRQLKKILDRLDSGTTVDAGGFIKNPSTAYTDPKIAALEREMFFTNHAQIIGMSGDLPEPHSFLTVDDLSTPILATRDSDGRFRAFVNSCRHRGVILQEAGRGTNRRFACQFHNWVYDSGGVLVGLPKQDHFGDVDTDCLGLIELPAVEKYGLLVVHPETDGTVDVDEVLGTELAAELASYGLDRLGFLDRDTYDVDCNWKLAMDTFGETYHFEILHRDSLAMSFHGNVQCYDTFGTNHRMLLCRRDIDQMRELPEDEWDILIGTLPVYWLFPNVILMPHRGGCFLVRAYPDPANPGRHRTQVTFYIWPEVAASPEFEEMSRNQSQGFADIIRDEDYVASASQQRTANSGALDHVIFGRNEPALQHYHNTYRIKLGMEPLPVVDAIA